MASSSFSEGVSSSTMKHRCGLQRKIWTCKQNNNGGLQFFGCANYKGPSCKDRGFFAWVDDAKNRSLKIEKEIENYQKN